MLTTVSGTVSGQLRQVSLYFPSLPPDNNRPAHSSRTATPAAHTQPALQAQQPPKGQHRAQRINHPTKGTYTYVPSVSTHGPKISESYQAKFLHQNPAPHTGPPVVNNTKSQNATSPADPEEAPSKPVPKPTPEQRSNTKGSSPELRQFPVFFQFFHAVFNSDPIFIFIQL